MPKAAHMLSRPGCVCRRRDMQSFLTMRAPDLCATTAELQRAHSFHSRLFGEGDLRLTAKFVQQMRHEV